MKPSTLAGLISGYLAISGLAGEFPQDPAGWPAVTSTTKPWTRWWWLGSAVDKPNLTRQLEDFAKAGLGGVEICPIYGAVGAEGRFIDFLSPQWMEMLAHTTTEAKRLGLGVDMTTGTGWPFGGPQVAPEMASAGLKSIRHEATGGTRVTLKLPAGKLECLRAFPESGPPLDLTGEAAQGTLDWLPPAGKWTVIGLASPAPIQKVKRAAPGGAGNVVDPWNPTSSTVAVPQDSGIDFRLEPGQSIVIRTFSARRIEGTPWKKPPATLQATAIEGL